MSEEIDWNPLGLVLGRIYRASASDCCISEVVFVGKLVQLPNEEDGMDYVFESGGSRLALPYWKPTPDDVVEV